MIADIHAIAWKEWKELLFQSGGLRSARFRLLCYLLVFGVLIPLRWGEGALTSGTGLILWAALPLMLIMNVIGDSFAGERERHTLETLLASRLPDEAILVGKMVGAVGYGWVMTLGSFLLAIITVNITAFQHGLVLPPVEHVGSIVGLTFLTGFVVSGGGVLASLRSSTVREAQQSLSIGLMIVMGSGFFALQLWPAFFKHLMDVWGLALRHEQFLVVVGALLAAGLVLSGVALARFQRNRLILS